MTRKKYLKPIFFIILAFYVVGLDAGPTAIRDDRVTDLAVTPALGRGYSISTSTYQSLCMSNVVTTKPSYNFRYKFEQLEEDGSRRSEVAASSRSKGGLSFFGFGVSADASAKTSVVSGETYNNHRILVTIEMDVYYASLDEAQTKLSDSAKTLLTNDDIPGFFDSCGPYYIRSIGRFAKFVSLFTYRSKETTRDVKFETALKYNIKGWGSGEQGGVDVSGELQTESSKKYLTIDTAAWGLGKDRLAKLISYDLKTFRSAINDAFLSMMDERTGMVTSIEVVPWVENTEFQRVIKLRDYVKEGGKKVNVYMQKRIMNTNAEFLAEMDRASRNRLNLYYKARMCGLRINRDYYKGNALDNTYKDRLLVNNRTGDSDEGIKLSDLDKLVSTDNQNDYMEKYESFVYGKTSGGGGGDDKSKKEAQASVQTCMKDLKTKNFRASSYRDVLSCRSLETQFAEIIGKTVDDYCMPQLSQEQN